MLEVHVQHQQGTLHLEAAFSIHNQGVTALFGPSGAGKTTLINMVAGLVRPQHGRIVLHEHCLFDSTQHIWVAPHKRHIGYVFQDGRLFPHLSVRANLTYGMRLRPPSNRFVPFDTVVSLLGIEPLLSRRPAKLSGGEKQRVAIGRALLCSPSLLLMDEPLASLDADRKAEVLPFIRRLSQNFGIPVLYVSHIMDEIRQLADALVVLKDGHVVSCGNVKTLADFPAIMSCNANEAPSGSHGK